jgi:ABC-type spermidine/putrescine transport systems, ATPase components
MVFQDFALFPHMSALDNVAFAAHRQPRQVQRQRAEELMDRVGLGHRLHAKPSQLSGGEQQRVALARALAGDPKILLLDEPYSSLDARLRDDLASMTRNIVRELGITAILVSHDGDEALRFADRVAFMKSGRLLFDGAMADLKERSVPPDLLQLLFPLTGVTLDHHGGATMATPWGQVLCLPDDLQGPGSVQLFTIPGAAMVEEHDSGLLLVRDNHDLGLTREMLLALPDGRELRLQDVRSLAKAGTRVSLSLDPERLFLFRSST